MNRTAMLGLSLLVSTVAWAEEPKAGEPVPVAEPAAPAAANAVPAPATPATAAAPQRATLNLRIRDIREYMTPDEYRALITDQVDDRNTVIVRADAPLLDMKSDLDVPGGIIAPFWAIANPHKAWRLLLPDARIDIRKIPPPETAVPPPAYRMSGP